MEFGEQQNPLRPQVIAKVTPTHEMMMHWILENPGGTLREMGQYFGYSVPWLSQVCNSDMFRSMLADKMKKVELGVVQDIPARLRGLAALSIERMYEVVENAASSDVIIESFDKVMNRYGYAPNGKNAPGAGAHIGQQNNMFMLSPADFAAVQGVIQANHSADPVQQVLPALEGKVLERSGEVPAS